MDNGFERALAYRDAQLLGEWHSTESYDVWKRHCDKLLANAVDAVLAGTRETFDERKGVVTGLRQAIRIIEAAQEDAKAWRAAP